LRVETAGMPETRKKSKPDYWKTVFRLVLTAKHKAFDGVSDSRALRFCVVVLPSITFDSSSPDQILFSGQGADW